MSFLSSSLGATTFHGEKGSLRWKAKELHCSSFDGPTAEHTTMSDMWAFGMVICVSLFVNVESVESFTEKWFEYKRSFSPGRYHTLLLLSGDKCEGRL